MTVRVRHKGQITIPADVRDAVQLDEGAELDVAVKGRDIVLSVVEAAEANGHDNGSSALPDDLQSRLERALEDVDAGRVTIYDDESFFNSLT